VLHVIEQLPPDAETVQLVVMFPAVIVCVQAQSPLNPESPTLANEQQDGAAEEEPLEQLTTAARSANPGASFRTMASD
jgi:hypothetical protein